MDQGYQPQGPMNTGMGGKQAPQFAQFEVGASGHAVVSEDALPPMPSWERAEKKHVEHEDEQKGGIEMDKLDASGQQLPLMVAQGPHSGATSPAGTEMGSSMRGGRPSPGPGGNNSFMNSPNRQDQYGQNGQNQGFDGQGRGYDARGPRSPGPGRGGMAMGDPRNTPGGYNARGPGSPGPGRGGMAMGDPRNTPGGYNSPSQHDMNGQMGGQGQGYGQMGGPQEMGAGRGYGSPNPQDMGPGRGYGSPAPQEMGPGRDYNSPPPQEMSSQGQGYSPTSPQDNYGGGDMYGQRPLQPGQGQPGRQYGDRSPGPNGPPMGRGGRGGPGGQMQGQRPRPGEATRGPGGGQMRGPGQMNNQSPPTNSGGFDFGPSVPASPQHQNSPYAPPQQSSPYGGPQAGSRSPPMRQGNFGGGGGGNSSPEVMFPDHNAPLQQPQAPQQQYRAYSPASASVSSQRNGGAPGNFGAGGERRNNMEPQHWDPVQR